MPTMMKNARGYDWATWIEGIFRSLIQGGSNGVLSGLISMGIDPDHFNLSGGLTHTFVMMGAMFAGTGVISLLIFLKTHGVPDHLQASLSVAADATAQAGAAIAEAQHSVSEKPPA